jgi:predicted ATPase
MKRTITITGEEFMQSVRLRAQTLRGFFDKLTAALAVLMQPFQNGHNRDPLQRGEKTLRIGTARKMKKR